MSVRSPSLLLLALALVACSAAPGPRTGGEAAVPYPRRDREQTDEERVQRARGGCARGDGDACTHEGMLHMTTTGDLAAALAAFRRACSRESGDGCHQLALIHLNQAAHRDENRAVYFLKRGCGFGSAVACREMALLHSRAGDWHNPDKAAMNLQRSCRLGLASACAEVRAMSAGRTKRTYAVREVTAGGLTLQGVACGIQSERSFALAEQIQALAVHKDAIGACGVRGRLLLEWTWRSGTADQVEITGAPAHSSACLEAALRKASFLLDGRCRGTLVL